MSKSDAVPAKPKYTQGPWESSAWRVLKYGEDHAAIAIVCDPHFGNYVSDIKEVDWSTAKIDRDIASANARLIVCAPEMAEMLREVQQNSDVRTPIYGRITELLKKAGVL